jgi:hypothetical protein
VNSTDLAGEQNEPYFTLGIIGLATGAIATPVGWIMFGENGSPEVVVQPLRRPL